MESENVEKNLKNSFFKKLERYLSIKRRSSKSSTKAFTKSRSWHSSIMTTKNDEEGPITNRQMAPSGCFSVQVSPEKQRFVIKTEFANHPLFKMLLEDAEMEYGFNREGPIQLPCEVDLFIKVLAELKWTVVIKGLGMIDILVVFTMAVAAPLVLGDVIWVKLLMAFLHHQDCSRLTTFRLI